MTDPATPAPARVTAWSPLALPVFRKLWLVWVTANVCMGMHDVAAARWMTSPMSGWARTSGWLGVSDPPVGLAAGRLRMV